jgi:two-component system chemotaxis response regulator CheY
LVVDDSRVIRRVARYFLERLDFKVTEAADGETAVARCRDEMPDAVLLDSNIAERNRYYPFLGAMRYPLGEKRKVVIFSTKRDETSIARAFEAGADAYLIKPLGVLKLKAKFRELGLID